jgi:uncharacterized protein with von Willebrand factor type A (vWA) domain
MPIPKYEGGDEKEYISKCMSAIGNEYNTQEQALAVCYKQIETMEETKLAAQPGKHTNLPQKPADHDVHHGATSDKAAEAVKPKGIGADENPNPKQKKVTKPTTMSAFDRQLLNFQVNMAKADLRERGINLADEGGASYPWDECIADQTAKYGAESAAKICGAIKAENS